MSARILVMRGGALGDFVLGLPALHALRAAYPDAHLELIAPSAILPLAANLADTLTPIERAEISALFADAGLPPGLAERCRYLDLAVLWLADLDGDVRRHFEHLGTRAVIQAPALPPKDGRIHATDHLLSTLTPPGTPLRDLPLSLGEGRGEGDSGRAGGSSPAVPLTHFAVPVILSSPEALERAASRLARLGLSPTDRLLAIHPGSGGRWKCWPPDRFARVAETVREKGFSPLLIQGPADADAVASVQSNLQGDSLPVVSGLAVGDLAALLSVCTAYLGNDSGVTHLAAAAGTPTVAIFGPTDPVVWGPRGPRVAIIREAGGRLDAVPADRVVEVLTQLNAAG